MNVFDLFSANLRLQVVEDTSEVVPNAEFTMLWREVSSGEDVVISQVNTWTQFQNPQDVPHRNWCALATFTCPPPDHLVYDFLNHLKISQRTDDICEIGRDKLATFSVRLDKGRAPCIIEVLSTYSSESIHNLVMNRVVGILPEELFDKVRYET